jgi:hypothetical protein
MEARKFARSPFNPLWLLLWFAEDRNSDLHVAIDRAIRRIRKSLLRELGKHQIQGDCSQRFAA